jgi:hypothetical protein
VDSLKSKVKFFEKSALDKDKELEHLKRLKNEEARLNSNPHQREME